MIVSDLALLGALTTWITPVWLLSLGVTLGLLVLLVLYGLLWLVARRVAVEIPSIVREGVLQILFYVVLLLVGFTIVAAPKMPTRALLTSVRRVMVVGPARFEAEIPPRTESHPIAIGFRGEELRELTITSDQDLVAAEDDEGISADTAMDIKAGEPFLWTRGEGDERLFKGDVEALVASNSSDAPARIRIDIRTGVEYPEVFSVLVTAGCLVAFFVLYVLFRVLFPKVSAIAATTSRQAMSQPVYYLALGLGAAALVIFVYVPYNTFGEDVKMLKDSGLTLIMVLGILVALWTASVSVADEIEGRTALTLLSKPIGRAQFIFGKFLGIIWPIALLFILLGFLFLVTVSYKVVYDARESARTEPIWQESYLEMIRIVPGLALAFMETVVLAAISVAISTRLPMLPNLIICVSIYVMGHLVPLIVDSSAAKFPIVRFFGLLIATVFPVLDHFNVQAAVAAGAVVPLSYLLWALFYCVLYSSIMMLLALAMFQDRDLA